MKMKYLFVVAAAVLAFAAASANAQATLTVAMSGSSALYLELGQASATYGNASPCHWSTTSKNFTMTDTRFTPNITDSGTAWITWGPGTGTCAAPTGTYDVNLMVSVDSTVGNRCFFAVMPGSAPAGGQGCVLTQTNAANTAGNGALNLTTSDTNLPGSIVTLLATGNSGSPFHMNSAATDIRPEDAAFATLRALTPCGQAVSGQYLGLGYQTSTPYLGVQISGSSLNHAGGGAFNVAGFNLSGTDPVTSGAISSFTVIPVGAVPVVVFVNPADTNGFGLLSASNVDRAVLSGYLDGTLARTTDLTAQSYTATNVGAYVYVREPVSGTYNTMEYNIPDTQSNQSSMDVGLAALNNFNNVATGPGTPPYLNCQTSSGSGTQGTGASAVVFNNPLQESGRHGSATGGRFRSIGTGGEVAAVLAQSDGLGFAFWSAANFKNAVASTGKYLTVDGIDPIQETWSDGLIPTAGNDLLGNVTFSHVKDGSYPIWSLLRVECPGNSSSATCTAVQQVATDALTFLSPFQPDFVPTTQLAVFRSHFAPPGINFPSSGSNVPANGHNGTSEAGGDVGGMVYTLQADGDYYADDGVAAGITGRRN